MNVRIGLIGAGTIGTSHARTIASGVTGARVVAVHDLDRSSPRPATCTSAATNSSSADPQVSMLRFSRGAIAAVEVYANAHSGFEVSCEVVGARGTVTTVAPHATRLRQAGHMRDPVAANHLERFAEAYRNELSRGCLARVGRLRVRLGVGRFRGQPCG